MSCVILISTRSVTLFSALQVNRAKTLQRIIYIFKQNHRQSRMHSWSSKTKPGRAESLFLRDLTPLIRIFYTRRPWCSSVFVETICACLRCHKPTWFSHALWTRENISRNCIPDPSLVVSIAFPKLNLIWSYLPYIFS